MKKTILLTYMLVTAFVCSAQTSFKIEGEVSVSTLSTSCDPFIDFTYSTGEFLYEDQNTNYNTLVGYHNSIWLCDESITHEDNVIRLNNNGQMITLVYSSGCDWIQQYVVYNEKGMVVDFYNFRTFETKE